MKKKKKGEIVRTLGLNSGFLRSMLLIRPRLGKNINTSVNVKEKLPKQKSNAEMKENICINSKNSLTMDQNTWLEVEKQ